MTVFELDQLYFLRRSIRHMRNKIIDLTIRAESATSNISGPHQKTGVWDKVSNAQIRIHDLKKQIEKEELEIKRLESWLASIRDTQTRLIFQMRYDYYDEQPYWKDIAAFIGGGNTEDSVRKIHSRFLEKSK